MMTATEPAALLLEDGTRFEGWAFGARGETSGEVVFNTSLTGYQEILTDPSYRAQLVTMTYPHIGNYGINPEDAESALFQAAGLIVRDACAEPSNWRSEMSLSAWMAAQGKIGLAGIDTRALVRHLRSRGAMRGAIITGDLALDRHRVGVPRQHDAAAIDDPVRVVVHRQPAPVGGAGQQRHRLLGVVVE
jgi:carbamoyl-phosphate synthase small subunit